LLPGIDMKKVMDVGSGLIRPLLGHRGIDPMAVTSGFARFHSSFAPKVLKYAEKHGIDVRDLIVRLCQEDLISAPDELLERLSGELAGSKLPRVLSVPVFGAGPHRSTEGRHALEALLGELRPHAVKAGKFSALSVVIGEAPCREIYVSGNIQHTQAHVAGSVTYTSDEQLATILQAAEGVVDVVLLDVDRKSFGPSAPATTAVRVLRKTVLLTYLDSRVWVGAVEDQLARLLAENLEGVRVVIAGDHSKSRLLAVRLTERRARVTILTKQTTTVAAGPPVQPPLEDSISYVQAGSCEAGDHLAGALLVVVWPGGAPWFGGAEAARLASDVRVLAADSHAFLREGLEHLQSRKTPVVRVNMWPMLAGTLLAAHESQRICRDSMGWAVIAGISVVAGGALGSSGDVIVDSVREPSRVIGVADGQGKIVFQYTPEQAERVRRVTAEIHSRILMPRSATAM
jgi:hypothetical protein